MCNGKLVRYLGYGVTKKIAGIRVQTSSISGRYLGLSDRRWHLQPRLVISGAKTGLRTKTSDSKVLVVEKTPFHHHGHRPERLCGRNYLDLALMLLALRALSQFPVICWYYPFRIGKWQLPRDQQRATQSLLQSWLLQSWEHRRF